MVSIQRPARLKTTKTMVLHCHTGRRTHSSCFRNHAISSIPIVHQDQIHNVNVAVRELCREGRLKDAMHVLLTATTNTNDSLPLVDSSTWLQLLGTCIAKKALKEGKLIHSHVTAMGFTLTTSIQNKLIHMYVNCASLANARKVFNHMSEPNVFSWNMIISGYQRHGFPRNALALFHQMQQAGAAVQPNQFTFPSVVQACAELGDLKEGLYIHQRLFKSGFLSDVVVVSALVGMYVKCHRIQKAREVFDKTSQESAVLSTAMIVGYAQIGLLERARELFDQMPHRDVVSWNAMIAGYAQNGLLEKALETFKQMQLAGVKPSSATFASILPVCTKMGALEEGMDIHRRIVENDFSLDVVVVSALIDMYAKCGRIHKARELFDKMDNANTVSWTAMITGYAQSRNVEKARELFDKMPHPDAVSWTAMIAGYAQNGFVEKARELFDKMPHQDAVSWTALIAGYVQNGLVEKARELFDKMPHQDAVSWNAMIAGYAQNGLLEEALKVFEQMQLASVKPSSVTFASILPTCAKMGALEQGMDIHQRIIESGFSSNVVVTNALIDMYAKCGNIHKARELFDKMHNANTVSWTTMIAGYAMHGYSQDVLKLFELMKHLGIIPDSVTFVCVLFACSHAGLVDECCKYFNSMSDSYCIIPTMDHYVCIVDLLGRAGYIEEAFNFIAKTPRRPELAVWMCLLGACRSHKNIGIGEFVATILFVLEPKYPASYVVLSNIYAEVGRWDDVQRVRTLMKDRGIKKTPGCSWIEVNKMVHSFCVGNGSHQQSQEIYEKLEELSNEMKAARYIPNTICLKQ